MSFVQPIFEAVLDERVPVIAFSFADPAPYARRAKDSGARVICQVQTIDAARQAMDAGADVLVAQGNEAGGHTGRQPLLPFLIEVRETWPDVPVLASGGVATGRALAAVLAVGADGAWMGTPLVATHEAVEVSEPYKQKIVAAKAGDSV
jgi:nitronate monooxygenase